MRIVTKIVCLAFAALACGGSDITDDIYHPIVGADADAEPSSPTAANTPPTPASLEYVLTEIIDDATGEVLPPDWSPPDTMQQGAEIGQTAEAVSISDGFGSLIGSQDRCSGSHWPAICNVPKHKFFALLRDPDTQTPTSNQSVALGNAIASQLVIWKQDGYLVSKATSSDQCTESCVHYHFGAMPSGVPAGVVAVTRLRGNASDVVSRPQGKLAKWIFAEVIVDLHALTTGGAENNLNATQKVFLETNTWQHEFGHASGLGHFGDGNFVLMGAQAIIGNILPLGDNVLDTLNTHLLPSAQERAFQASFVGDLL